MTIERFARCVLKLLRKDASLAVKSDTSNKGEELMKARYSLLVVGMMLASCLLVSGRGIYQRWEGTVIEKIKKAKTVGDIADIFDHEFSRKATLDAVIGGCYRLPEPRGFSPSLETPLTAGGSMRNFDKTPYCSLFDLVVLYGNATVVKGVFDHFFSRFEAELRGPGGAEKLFTTVCRGGFCLSLDGILDKGEYEACGWPYVSAIAFPISNPLALACQKGDLAMVNAVISWLNESLTKLARLDLLSKYLNYGSNVWLDEDRLAAYWTPLTLALWGGHIECAKALLEAGAPLSNGALDPKTACFDNEFKTNNKGPAALLVVTEERRKAGVIVPDEYVDVVKLLKEAGIEPRANK